MENNNNIYIKVRQMFSNELKDRLKDIGTTIAFTLDNKDIVFRKDENTLFSFKSNPYLAEEIENISIRHKEELLSKLQEWIEVIIDPDKDSELYELIFPEEVDEGIQNIIDALNWFEFNIGDR